MKFAIRNITKILISVMELFIYVNKINKKINESQKRF